MSLRAAISALAATGAAVLLAAGGAQGAKTAAPVAPRLWATINACDTVARPDTLGIRGSMPRTTSGDEEMFMRFQAQYFSTEDNTWHNVTAGGDSGYQRVGTATKTRQRGWYFKITPAGDTGATVLLRGMVMFEWRLKGEVVRHARQRSHKGHKSNAGADPPGYSATNCTITK
jgi:hypothetical protein